MPQPSKKVTNLNDKRSGMEPVDGSPMRETYREASHDQISRRAYEIWQANGSPDGHHEEHWHQAEQELLLGDQ